MKKAYYKRRSVLKKIYQQQYDLFHRDKKPGERIVNIHKDYLRPIVRGKEIKVVEFGAKVNKYQIDGISFIEHLSFDNFHEGRRFKGTVFKAQRLTKTKVRLAGADAIYASNVKRKGRASKHEKHRQQLAKAITKERASPLEGSFGNEKEHYRLKKIKARGKPTEILWIFFGIHTANALQIGKRIHNQTIKKQPKITKNNAVYGIAISKNQKNTPYPELKSAIEPEKSPTYRKKYKKIPEDAIFPGCHVQN